MITQELIAKINDLANKAKTIGLSAAEKETQAKLRRQYLDGIRHQVEASLKPQRQPQQHTHDCDCGCRPNNIH